MSDKMRRLKDDVAWTAGLLVALLLCILFTAVAVALLAAPVFGVVWVVCELAGLPLDAGAAFMASFVATLAYCVHAGRSQDA